MEINWIKNKDEIKTAIDNLKETLKDENSSPAEIKTKLDALNTAAMKLGEIMYKQNQGQEQSEGEDKQKSTAAQDKKDDTKTGKDEDVVDADFEEIQEDQEKKSNN